MAIDPICRMEVDENKNILEVKETACCVEDMIGSSGINMAEES